MIGTKSRLTLVLGVWLAANFVPHLIIFLATGQIYYQLSARRMIVCESSIMLLNVLLPVVAVRYWSSPGDGVLHSLGWQWNGWRALALGLAGLLAAAFFMLLVQRTIGDPLAVPGRQFAPGETIALLLMLLVLTAAAEETMFRGYIQTALAQDCGPWVGVVVAAMLFGLRHLPMDLYAGLSQTVPSSAWTSRMLQLYIGALILGLTRHWAKSTWASWIMHEGLLILIVIMGVATAGRS